MHLSNPFTQVAALLESINSFLLLLIAIACEIVGTTALRLSVGFTKLLPAGLVVVCYLLSFYLYALVLKQVPMGVAYAIWAGLGTVGVVLVGVLAWRDPLNLWQVAGMALVVTGVVVLNAFTPAGG